MLYSRNKDHQFHKWRQQKSWISYPDCQNAQDTQRTQYLLISRKNGRCTKFLKIPKSEFPDIWIRLSRHKWSKSWCSMEDPVVPLERNLYGHPLAGLLWEKQFEKILLKRGWVKVPNWEYLFVHRQEGFFLSVYVYDMKLTGKKQNIDRYGKYSIKKWIWENRYLSLIMYIWDVLKDNEK